MKRIKVILTMMFACMSLSFFAQENTCNARKSQLFNFDWKFMLGDPKNAESISFDDSQWRKLTIPHDFQIEMPWDSLASRGRGFKAMATGWYRKSFQADESWKGQRVSLDFEGIMLTGDVWVNGQKIGGTDYGYLGFEADITDILKYGQPNVVAVHAYTGESGDSRWYTGGGLFRDVHLVVRPSEVGITRHGIFVTTPVITEQNAEVNVQVEVDGIFEKNYDLEIQTRILSPDGTLVAETKTKAPKNSKLPSIEIPLPSMNVPHPQLWSCETPNLYTAEVTLVLDGKAIDYQKERFGIRTIEFSNEFGLKLNGKKVFLQGVANHHDVGAIGAAAYETAIERMMDRIKEYGFNHIRTSHNPYSESFLDLCDENGILVVDELYDKWNDQYVGGGRAHFANLWMDHVAEFIKRDRNHPCVVLWSMGNELQSYNDTPFNDWGVTQYRLMKTLIQRYDSTRKVTVAMHPRYRNWETDSLPCDLAKVTDIQAYNYRYMYFPGDGKRFPWMNFYQSEASTSAMGENFFGMELDKVIGLAYWGAIDYLGESQGWPAKCWAQGVFDIALEPKPKAYYMRSFFKPDEPVVHIAVTESKGNVMWNGVQTGNDGQSDHWNRTPGTKLSLTTYTNADEVELLVNGKSYGIKKNDKTNPKMRNQIRWENVVYQDGNCEAIARTNGKVVARHKIVTVGKAVALKAVADNSDWKADGMDLQHIRIIAVDSKGRRVPNAVADVKVNVVGDAQLVAMSNGNINSDELNVTDHQSLFNGSCLAILRSGVASSPVVVNISAPGLKAAKLKLATK